MLHAAALLAGLILIWLIATPHAGLDHDVIAAAVAALAATVVCARLGGVAPNAFGAAPQFLFLIGARAQAVFAGAVGTLRAGLAADVTLKPALVRVRTRTDRAFAKAGLADMVSAAPGAVVVDTDAEGMLVHVLNEDAIDAEQLGALEAHVSRALGGGARA